MMNSVPQYKYTESTGTRLYTCQDHCHSGRGRRRGGDPMAGAQL